MLLYAYNFPIGDKVFVKGGLEAGVTQTNINWDQLLFFDQIDPIEGPLSGAPTEELQPEDLRRTYFDAGAGLLVFSEYFYGGFSLKTYQCS